MLFLDNFLQNFQIKQKQDLKLQQPNANPAVQAVDGID